jgi:hypothetical protein
MKVVSIFTAVVLLAGAAWADGMMTDGKDHAPVQHQQSGAMSSGSAMSGHAMPSGMPKKGKTMKHDKAMQSGAMHSGAMSAMGGQKPKTDTSH